LLPSAPAYGLDSSTLTGHISTDNFAMQSISRSGSVIISDANCTASSAADGVAIAAIAIQAFAERCTGNELPSSPLNAPLPLTNWAISGLNSCQSLALLTALAFALEPSLSY